ncbi:Zinc carboxypeptidase A 1, partial [Pseudolycoriella hygida]
MTLLKLILSLTLFTVVVTEPQRFDNYKVYEIKVENKDHVNILRSLEGNASDEYDFWNSPIVGRNADIMVSPEKTDAFEKMMKNFNMTVGVKVLNLQDLIDRETPKVTPRAGFNWESYQSLDDIYAWLDELLAAYPGILSPHLVGYSYEGREIRAVKLSHKE